MVGQEENLGGNVDSINAIRRAVQEDCLKTIKGPRNIDFGKVLDCIVDDMQVGGVDEMLFLFIRCSFVTRFNLMLF